MLKYDETISKMSYENGELKWKLKEMRRDKRHFYHRSKLQDHKFNNKVTINKVLGIKCRSGQVNQTSTVIYY